MTDNQRQWVRTKAELVSNIERLGFPGELGEQLAKMLGSPKAMERMISYLHYVKPNKAEIIVDEALAEIGTVYLYSFITVLTIS